MRSLDVPISMRPRVVVLALVVTGACASCAESPQAEPTCPDTHRERLRIGDWNGEALLALPKSLPIEYGSQGGQHIFVDVVLESGCAKRFSVKLDFVDDSTGRVVGLGDVPAAPRECRALLEDLFVFLETDEPRTGTLEVTATSDECELRAERDVTLLGQ